MVSKDFCRSLNSNPSLLKTIIQPRNPAGKEKMQRKTGDQFSFDASSSALENWVSYSS